LGCMWEWSHFLLPALHHNHNHHHHLWLWSSLFIWPVGQPFLNTLWSGRVILSYHHPLCQHLSVTRSLYIDCQVLVQVCHFSLLMFESVNCFVISRLRSMWQLKWVSNCVDTWSWNDLGSVLVLLKNETNVYLLKIMRCTVSDLGTAGIKIWRRLWSKSVLLYQLTL
jgi:hypothetical protein